MKSFRHVGFSADISGGLAWITAYNVKSYFGAGQPTPKCFHDIFHFRL
jgi:hypothetical protein